jgi:hypothetical protein
MTSLTNVGLCELNQKKIHVDSKCYYPLHIVSCRRKIAQSALEHLKTTPNNCFRPVLSISAPSEPQSALNYSKCLKKNSPWLKKKNPPNLLTEKNTILPLFVPPLTGHTPLTNLISHYTPVDLYGISKDVNNVLDTLYIVGVATNIP